MGGVTSGVRGNKGGSKASGVNAESHRVGEGEGGLETSIVVENPRGGGATVWAGDSSCLRDPTPPEWPRGPGGAKPQESTHRLRTDRERTDRGRGGGGQKLTHRLSNQDVESQGRQWRADEQTSDGGTTQHNGDGR